MWSQVREEPPPPSSLIYGLKSAGARRAGGGKKTTQTGLVLPADTQTTPWHFCISVPLIPDSGILIVMVYKDGSGLMPLASE